MTQALVTHTSGLKAKLDERNPGKISVAIESLSSHYPRMNRDDVAARIWARDWIADTAHLPPMVIEEACREWRTSTERWMPTPGQLIEKAERVYALKLAELRACERIKRELEDGRG